MLITIINLLSVCILQIDRLQTESQEKDLMKSQSETVLKSELADREEDIHRLKAEICVLHEKLSQNSGQVRLRLSENRNLCCEKVLKT